ncbi:MAG: aldehyde ferredoxin oxidoreductase family protein, partial [Candidatus Lokiarchaeota archaeon]|nr:aldehyde ferredoxin oxidoreductase family protein [Candidatus Lokiarchaeota archaeon]
MAKVDIGKILEVDLEKNSYNINKYGRENIEKFLGGPGYAINYLMDEKTFNYDPLDNANVLALMTGLLTGTAYPCSGFYSVSARSPQTNIYGEGLSGGFFAAELRNLFNGIVFKNKSESPKYLLIENDHFELKDASSLWGLTTDKTIKDLNSKHGKEYKIACIGPSGEKQVPLACIMNDHHRAVGRTGMGAIMGSKNLKAIAVKSSKKKIEYHDEDNFRKISQLLFKSFQKSPMAEILRNYGTNNITYFERLYDVPHKNWTLHKWREVSKISGEVVFEKYHVRNKPCYLCPFMCGREIEIKEGPYKIENAAGAEYETTAAFGAMCLISDVEAIAYLNDLCNIMGVDTISTGCTISFALDCYEHGILTEEDIGFPLEWGDAEAIVKLARLICEREGIGKTLSLGSRKASDIIGKGSEQFLTDVKGLEAPMHDPRGIFPLGLQYATSNRGACHGRGYANDQYSGFTGFNDSLKITKEKSMRERTIDDPKFARDIALTQNLAEVVNALGICKQTMTSGSQIVDGLLDKLLDVLYYLTGIKFTLKNLMKIGERIFNLKRLYNTKCGITRNDDKLPPRLMFPLEKGL